jgi:tRNA-specific 2-thiouridylase
MTRIVVAMSGGVDSSVAASLLVEAGHECLGVFMRHGQPALPSTSTLPIVEQAASRPGHQGCCSVSDAIDARRVADKLNIPLYPLDLTSDFEQIIDAFAADYGAGRTPNPCVRCNQWIKFGRLFDYADAVGATHVATGHYAQLLVAEGEAADQTPELHRGHDPGRDQSYVLFGIGSERLRRMLLPVGGLAKTEVRQRAENLGLITASKPDSQEICFVPPGEHPRLVAHRLGGSRAGEIVDQTGQVLGQHTGIEQFTIGQRQGLGIAVGSPLYVLRIEADRCRVVVGPKTALPLQTLTAREASWITPVPDEPFECLVQCRAQRPAARAVVSRHGPDCFTARFLNPTVDAPGPITPGQPAVCYAGSRLLGGGWIDSPIADWG